MADYNITPYSTKETMSRNRSIDCRTIKIDDTHFATLSRNNGTITQEKYIKLRIYSMSGNVITNIKDTSISTVSGVIGSDMTLYDTTHLIISYRTSTEIITKMLTINQDYSVSTVTTITTAVGSATYPKKIEMTLLSDTCFLLSYGTTTAIKIDVFSIDTSTFVIAKNSSNSIVSLSTNDNSISCCKIDSTHFITVYGSTSANSAKAATYSTNGSSITQINVQGLDSDVGYYFKIIEIDVGKFVALFNYSTGTNGIWETRINIDANYIVSVVQLSQPNPFILYSGGCIFDSVKIDTNIYMTVYEDESYYKHIAIEYLDNNNVVNLIQNLQLSDRSSSTCLPHNIIKIINNIYLVSYLLSNSYFYSQLYKIVDDNSAGFFQLF